MEAISVINPRSFRPAKEPTIGIIEKIVLYIQYYLATLLDFSWDRQYCFGSTLIVPSHNYGKIEDVATYCLCQKEGMRLNPYWNEGVCFGATAHMAERYMKKGEKAFDEFRDGVPTVGVAYQTAYEKAYGSKISPSGFIYKKSALCPTIVASRRKRENFFTKLPSLENGVYQIFLAEAEHVVLLIKKEERLFLYDPNYGICENAWKNAAPVMRKLLKNYNSDECCLTVNLMGESLELLKDTTFLTPQSSP